MEQQEQQLPQGSAPDDGQVGANGFAQFDPNMMYNGANPDAMAGMMPDQPLLQDPNMGAIDMGGMAMGDPSLLMPMFNGQLGQPQPPSRGAITPGKLEPSQFA